MYTLANSEDPGEMLHNAVFISSGSTLFAKLEKNLQRKEYQFYLEIMCESLQYIQLMIPS